MKNSVLFAFSLILLAMPLQAQWRAVGPYGGAVYQVCPLESSLFALTSEYAPISAFTSLKSSIEWTKLRKPFAFTKRLNHLFSYKNAIYASTEAGAYRSTDGENWERIFQNLPLEDMPKRIRQIFMNDKLILVGTDNGLIRSTDQGASWDYPQRNNSNLWGEIVAATPSGDTIVAALNNGIHFTRDKGVTWDTALTNDYPNENTVSSIFIKDGKFFISGRNGFFYSNDGMSSWKKLVATYSYNKIVEVSDTLLIASVNGQGGLRYYVPKDDSYELSASKLGSEQINDLIYSDGILYAAGKNGVFVSTDQGNTWSAQNKGLRKIPASRFSTLQDSLLFGTWDFGSYITGDLGENWSSPAFDKEITRATFFPSPTPDGLCYGLAPYLDKIYYTTDNWQNWETRMLPTNVRTLTLLQTDDAILSGAISGMYISRDTARTWSLIDSSLLAYQFYCFARNSKGILAGTDLGILRSTDNGESWSKVPHHFAIPSIKGITANGSLAVAYNEEGNIYFSWDYGEHWNTIYTPYDYISATLIGRTIVYNAPDRGIFLSRDYGATWEMAGYDFSDERVYSLYVFGDYLFAGSEFGVFVAKLSDLGIVKGVEDAPGVTSTKVFPNPTAEFLEISTPWTAFFAEVFTSDGRKALSFANEKKLNVSGLSPGMYMLAVSSGNKLEVVPFIVAR
ncbi:MAG: T9SS type A sorting domain-containing protein [Chloroflexota bacterium]